MATLRFLLKRFFAQRLLGLAIVVTLGFTIGVLVAGPIYADAAREAILSSAVSTAPVTVKNVRFLTYGNPAYDHETADATLEDEASSLPIGETVPQGRGTVRLVGDDPNAPLSLTVLFRDGATDHLPFRGQLARRDGGQRDLLLGQGRFLAAPVEVAASSTVAPRSRPRTRAPSPASARGPRTPPR